MGAREQLARGATGFLRYVVAPIVGFGVAVAIIWLLASYWVLDRYRITATVLRIDAPAECWEAQLGSSRSLTQDREAYRSSVPEERFLYCGIVELDRGWVELPLTLPRPWVSSSRATLLGQLKVGCRYDLVLHDPRRDLREVTWIMPSSDPPRILHIAASHPCEG